ncbi:MAG: hypothetical protein WD157_01965 [Patescibacteria group bacterium]
MKAVYIASRTAQKSRAIKLLRLLEAKGYRSKTDWLIKPMLKPYNKHREEAKKFARECIAHVLSCDVFILLSDEAGTGMYIELGAALAKLHTSNKTDIYLVGPHGANSIFTYYPGVKTVDSDEELLSLL